MITDDQVRALMVRFNYRYPMDSRLADMLRAALTEGAERRAAAERVVAMVNTVRKEAEANTRVTLVTGCALFEAARACCEKEDT